MQEQHNQLTSLIGDIQTFSMVSCQILELPF